ncbi:hypothetical protein [Acinetobacter sp. CFCC 10889]|uniref:hypothetical protein n=1 Tax=Acinetobacter sp. CFCC 10889 TaxID=1775557 RepID=UPI000DCFBB7E|nr:hypothetical protein [Acinetobacter sp. CFCC 10889]
MLNIKKIIVLLCGLIATQTFALPDDIEKIVVKKVNDERNWVASKLEFAQKNHELITHENYGLSVDLMGYKLDLAMQKVVVSTDKAIAEKGKTLEIRNEYKDKLKRDNLKLAEIKSKIDEILCPNLELSLALYIHQKANPKFSNLSSLQVERTRLESAVEDVDYKKCLTNI